MGTTLYAQSVITSAMMLPVNIHELLGMGLRAARLEKRWRQQDASKKYRAGGLKTWTPEAVGQVENGWRKPSISDYLLACIVLEMPLADLVPDVDEMVDLGTGAAVHASAVRAILAGARPNDLPARAIRTPDDVPLADLLGQRESEIEPLIRPIWARAAGRTLLYEDLLAPFLPPTEAEERAAERLGVLPVQLKAASRVMWERDFEDERDARTGNGTALPSSLQARRGHATRAMLAELKEFMAKCGIAEGSQPEESGDG